MVTLMVLPILQVLFPLRHTYWPWPSGTCYMSTIMSKLFAFKCFRLIIAKTVNPLTLNLTLAATFPPYFVCHYVLSV